MYTVLIFLSVNVHAFWGQCCIGGFPMKSMLNSLYNYLNDLQPYLEQRRESKYAEGIPPSNSTDREEDGSTTLETIVIGFIGKVNLSM